MEYHDKFKCIFLSHCSATLFVFRNVVKMLTISSNFWITDSLYFWFHRVGTHARCPSWWRGGSLPFPKNPILCSSFGPAGLASTSLSV